jgi:hypothetical protein
MVHQYTGAYEQFTCRDDARDWTRSQEAHEIYKGDDHAEVVDDAMCPWLRNFVERQGQELAGALLVDVGAVSPNV